MLGCELLPERTIEHCAGDATDVGCDYDDLHLLAPMLREGDYIVSCALSGAVGEVVERIQRRPVTVSVWTDKGTILALGAYEMVRVLREAR